MHIWCDTHHLHICCELGSSVSTQARFLFRQIIDLLLALHYPPEGEPAYYHGDIKDQNFVVSGSTLKLIDYGTLSKVRGDVS